MRLIDADALKEDINLFYADELVLKDSINERVDEMPTIDAVEVVRCKDCKHFKLNVWSKVNDVPLIVAHEICEFWGGGCKTKQDGFCAAGERRSDEDR